MRNAGRLWLVALAGCAPDGAGAPVRVPVGAQRVASGEAPRFRDVSAAWGVAFVHDAGRTPEKHLPEAMGHGAALLDADADGDLDLYLVQGGGIVADARPADVLYLNAGDGRMRPAPPPSDPAGRVGYGMGVVTGDADGDGHCDLYLTNLGADALLRGDGDGGLADGTRAAGIDEARWTTGAAFFDAENDGDLDLYVAGYVEVDLEDPLWCGRHEPGWRTVCHPDAYPGLQDRFWRNDGAGRFADETEAAGVSDSWGKGLGVIACDLDGDGWLDLYVANDSVENRLWHNAGDGTFEDRTLLSGTGYDGRGTTEAGMGLAAGDVDGDGDPELYVTNFDHESHTLYRNEGGLVFTDVTAEAGLDGPTRMPVGFGTVLADLDADGDLDLAVASGHIVDLIARYDDAQTWRQPAQLFLNAGGGRFRDASAEAGDLTATPRVGRGLYAGDLDGDGALDLVATECGGPTVLLRNERHAGRAAVLDGLPRGARLAATLDDGRVLVREVGPQPSYLGQSAPRAHLGLGGRSIVGLALRLGGRDEAVSLEGPLGAGHHRLARGETGWRVEREVR